MVRGGGKFYRAHGGEHERDQEQADWLKSFANEWGKTSTVPRNAVEVARNRNQPLPLTTQIQNSLNPSSRPKFNSVDDVVSHYRDAVGMDDLGTKTAEYRTDHNENPLVPNEFPYLEDTWDKIIENNWGLRKSDILNDPYLKDQNEEELDSWWKNWMEPYFNTDEDDNFVYLNQLGKEKVLDAYHKAQQKPSRKPKEKDVEPAESYLGAPFLEEQDHLYPEEPWTNEDEMSPYKNASEDERSRLKISSVFTLAKANKIKRLAQEITSKKKNLLEPTNLGPPKLFIELPDVERFVINIIETNPRIQIPAILHSIKEVFGIDGVDESQLNDEHLAKVLNALLISNHKPTFNNYTQLGRGVGLSDPDSGKVDNPFASLMPERIS